jgi:hypothetical protein
MSDLAEFKYYLTAEIKHQGHIPSRWYWAPWAGTPGHEATCQICDGVMQIWWEREEALWVADGDLVLLQCNELR